MKKRLLCIVCDNSDHERRIRVAFAGLPLYQGFDGVYFIHVGASLTGRRFERIIVFDRRQPVNPAEADHRSRWFEELRNKLSMDCEGLHYV